MPISDGHNPKPRSLMMLSEETLAPSAGCSVLGCPQVLQWQETRAHRAHLNASADVVHDLDGPAVLVAREGLGKSGDLHPPFGLGPRFLPVDGLTGGALQAAVLQGGEKQASELLSLITRTRGTQSWWCWASSVPCCRWSTWPARRACGRSAGSSSGARPSPA